MPTPPALGAAEATAFAGSAVAYHFGMIASASPSPIDWQGLSAFVLAICGLCAAVGSLLTVLVKLWVQVTDNRTKIRDLENGAAASADEILKVKDEALTAARAETDRLNAEILRLRTNQHRTAGVVQELKAKSDLADMEGSKVLNVNVVNDDAHPVPVANPSGPPP